MKKAEYALVTLTEIMLGVGTIRDHLVVSAPLRAEESFEDFPCLKKWQIMFKQEELEIECCRVLPWLIMIRLFFQRGTTATSTAARRRSYAPTARCSRKEWRRATGGSTCDARCPPPCIGSTRGCTAGGNLRGLSHTAS